MSYIIEGMIIGHKDEIPIVSNSSVKKASKNGKVILKIIFFFFLIFFVKNKVIYRRISENKLTGIKKRTSQIGGGGERLKKSTPERPRKRNGYQIFNEIIKEKKNKNRNFSLNMEEKKKKWAKINSMIADGTIKITKGDIRRVMNSSL